MRKHFIILFVIIILLTILTACWDQRLLRDHTLILGIGYDRGDDDQLLKTISFPSPSNQKSTPNKESTEKNASKIVSTTGSTVKDAEKKLDKTIPEQFDRSKTRIILFGNKLAKEGIFSTLDSLYRDLRGPLNAHAAIFDGKTKEALSTKAEDSLLVSDVYAELLISAERSGIIKNHSIQETRPFILAEGRDLILPLLSLDEKDQPHIDGMALFHVDQMTGILNMKETIVYLMLSDQVTKNLAINLQVSEEEEEPAENFINISIRSNKQKMKVQTKGKNVEAQIDVDLNVEIDEYAADHLDNKKKVETLEDKIEQSLKDIAKETIRKMQEADNDALGIGEKVRAYHHNKWKQMDWKDAYQRAQIEASFNVDIVHHGIIN